APLPVDDPPSKVPSQLSLPASIKHVSRDSPSKANQTPYQSQTARCTLEDPFRLALALIHGI
ncbi:MAG: hypothetical protein AAF670_12065, partial [Planctomycetota bacterium]